MDIKKYCIWKGNDFYLSHFSPEDTGKYHCKSEAVADMKANVKRMIKNQGRFHADGRYGILILFQGIDASGKDGIIKHVMSGFNPQGVNVYSFKKPTPDELAHDYLWRCIRMMPKRGHIGIFNRSYYEEVTTVKIHRDNLLNQNLPEELMGEDLFERRYEEINNYEKYLSQNGFIVFKFFLHISKEEQKKRLLSRVKQPDKHWKFSVSDIKERGFWEDYQKAFEEMIRHTGTDYAPWHVIPADHKWYARYLVSEVIIKQVETLDVDYPPLSEERERELLRYNEKLLGEN